MKNIRLFFVLFWSEINDGKNMKEAFRSVRTYLYPNKNIDWGHLPIITPTPPDNSEIVKKESKLEYGDIVHKLNEKTGVLETFKAVHPKAICAVCGKSYGGEFLVFVRAWIMIHKECEDTEAYRKQEFIAPSVIFMGEPVLEKIEEDQNKSSFNNEIDPLGR